MQSQTNSAAATFTNGIGVEEEAATSTAATAPTQMSNEKVAAFVASTAIAKLLHAQFVVIAPNINTPSDLVQQCSVLCPRAQIFVSAQTPRLSLSDYIYSVIHHTKSAEEVVIGALCILLRVTNTAQQQQTRPVVAPLCAWTAHRLFITCLTLSLKTIQDHPVNMKNIAYYGGIAVGDLKQLELALLAHMEYSVSVHEDEFCAVREVVYAEMQDIIFHSRCSNAGSMCFGGGVGCANSMAPTAAAQQQLMQQQQQMAVVR